MSDDTDGLREFLEKRAARKRELAERATWSWERLRLAHAAYTAGYHNQAIDDGEREYQRRMKANRRARAGKEATT